MSLQLMAFHASDSDAIFFIIYFGFIFLIFYSFATLPLWFLFKLLGLNRGLALIPFLNVFFILKNYKNRVYLGNYHIYYLISIVISFWLVNYESISVDTFYDIGIFLTFIFYPLCFYPILRTKEQRISLIVICFLLLFIPCIVLIFNMVIVGILNDIAVSKKLKIVPSISKDLDMETRKSIIKSRKYCLVEDISEINNK